MSPEVQQMLSKMGKKDEYDELIRVGQRKKKSKQLYQDFFQNFDKKKGIDADYFLPAEFKRIPKKQATPSQQEFGHLH